MLNNRPQSNFRQLKTSSKAVKRAYRSEPTVTQQFGGKRARGQQNVRLPYTPPERWHEPVESPTGYRFVMDDPGVGYRFVLTPDEVRNRLAQLPAQFVKPLQVVHFAQMTRKKRRSPCYGMQWGSTIYLYPIEVDLIEHYDNPPRPGQLIEAQMYGGQWEEGPAGHWRLVWTESAIKDFFLNNILIHELGHLLDGRNSRTVDRERYAEWFAIEHGYRPTQAERRQRRA